VRGSTEIVVCLNETSERVERVYSVEMR